MAFLKYPIIPIISFAASSAFSWIALHNRQRNRIYYLPFILATAVISFRRLNDFSSWYGLDSLWGLFIVIYVAHITSVLYVKKRELLSENYDDDNCGTSRRQTRWDFKAAYKIWNNSRWLQTSNEAPGVVVSRPNAQHHTTTVTRFVFMRIAKLLIFGVATLVFSSKIFPGHFQPLHLEDFAAEKEIYIRRLFLSTEGVTMRETLLRAALAIQWVFVACILLDSCHHILALIFVGILRLDQPDEWPPCFGSPLEAYSIRRFWSKFWNRATYRPYTSYVAILSRQILRFESNSGLDKLCISFTVFLISGAAHSAVSWQAGHRCGVWRDVGWFVANFLAATCELALQKQVRPLVEHLELSMTVHQSRCLRLFFKLVGFFWVFTFFFWSVPKWQYAKVYCILLDRMDDSSSNTTP